MHWASTINKPSSLVLLGFIILSCSSCQTIPSTYNYTVDLRGTFIRDESHIAIVSQRSGRGKIESYKTGPELPNPVLLSNDVAFWCNPAFNRQMNSVIFYSGDKSKIYSCSLDDYSISEIAEPMKNFNYLYISEDGNTILDDRSVRRKNPLLRVFDISKKMYKEYGDVDVGKDIRAASISPNGKLIVYHSNNDLYLLNTITDDVESLSFDLYADSENRWEITAVPLRIFD